MREVKKMGAGRILLWGRSMGSVSALLYTLDHQGEKDVEEGMAPAGLILDSPFKSFKHLAYDLTSNGMISIPQFAVTTVLSLIRRSVEKRAGFDLFQVKPIKRMSSTRRRRRRQNGRDSSSSSPGMLPPALFLVAEADELIPPWHGEALEEQYNGPSLGLRFEGTHNSARPPVVYTLATVFITAVTERAAGPFGQTATEMALRLVEKTAVVTSQEDEELLRQHEEAMAAEEEDERREDEEEEEGGGGDGHHGSHNARRRERRRARQRRRRQRRGPYGYGGIHEEDGESGSASGSHMNGKKKPRKRHQKREIPRFIRAGSHSIGNIPGAARALVGTLDVNLATRAIEEYLMEELLLVGVTIVQAQLQAALQLEKTGNGTEGTGVGERDAANVALSLSNVSLKFFFVIVRS